MTNIKTTTPAADGFAEISKGVWLESGATDPSRSGRIMLIEPSALTSDHMLPLSEIAQAYKALTGWTMSLANGATFRADGWVICLACHTKFVFLPKWIKDPGGCSWAEALPV